MTPAAEKSRSLVGLPRLSVRFSLRTFLIVCVAFSIHCGWFGIVYLRVRKQRAILARISAAGGHVGYERAAKRVLASPPQGPFLWRRFFGDEPFADVEHVFFRHHELTTDDDLAFVAALPNLKSVSTGGPKITDKGLTTLTSATQLRELSLSLHEPTVSLRGFLGLYRLPALEDLSLFGPAFTDEIVSEIGNIEQLKSLQLIRSSASADSLKSIGQLTNLERLHLYQNGTLGQTGLQHLESLKKLRELRIIVAGVTDEGLQHIAQLRNLEYLELRFTHVTGISLGELAKIPMLRTLRAGGDDIGPGLTDNAAHALRGMEQLHWLELFGNSITDASTPSLATLINLRRLELDHTQISDTGIMQLRTLTNLERLSVGPNVSVEAATELKKSLPYCRIDGSRPNAPDFIIHENGVVEDGNP